VSQLDRMPIDDVELLIVNAFSQVRTVEEIWIRYVVDDAGVAVLGEVAPRKCRVYFAFNIVTSAAGQRIREIRDGEFAQHLHGRNLAFEFVGMPLGTMPPDQPSRIWKKETDDEQRGIYE